MTAMNLAERERAGELYRSVVELAPDSIITVDLKGLITSSNTAATRILGYSRDELVGKHFSKIGVIRARNIPKYLKLFNSALRGQVAEPLELTFKRKDGTAFLAEVRVGVLKEGGKTIGLQAVSRDITERKRAEEKYRTLVEQSLQGLVIIQDFRIVYANPAFSEISGYTLQELMSLSSEEVMAMVDPEDQALVWGRFRDRLEGKPAPPRYEYRVVRKDGTVRWLQMFAHRVDYQGKPAVQAAIVDITEGRRAEEEIIHRTKQLALINEVGRTITGILDEDTLLSQVVDLIAENFGYYFVHVFEIDDDAQYAVFKAGTGEVGRVLKQEAVRLRIGEEGIIGWVASTGQPLMANDVTKEPRYSSHPALPDARSELAVPIRLGQKITGVLDVQSTELGAFDESDLATLATLADQLAVAMENARLYQEEWRRTHELSVLLGTAQTIAASLDLQQVLETIAHQAKGLTRADGCRIYLLEPDEETLKASIALGEHAEEIMATAIPVGQGITGHVAATGAPEIANQDEGDPRAFHIPGTPREAQCLMCVPLALKGRVIGVMTLSRQGQKEFRRGDLQLLTSLASQAATAIENARLYEETKRLAVTDTLTGVWNRRHIAERLRTEVARAGRFGRELSVLVMDIDNLKLFNDTYGHSAGDEVIRIVAQVLLTSCREIDIVGRYGGDEFALILPECSAHGATKVADRILTALEGEPFQVPGSRKVPVSLSIGAASYPSDSHEVDRLFSLADAAMYKAKAAGGGQFASLGAGPEEMPEELDSSLDVLKGLVISVDAKDHYTFKHSQEVTQYALALAGAMGLSEEDMKALDVAGRLHDVGKIGVRTAVLRKPGPLTSEEWRMVRVHPRLGEMLLQQVPEKEAVLKAVLHHHERYDGMGYPDGLNGEEIPLLARILAVADGFSAMTTDRPYRKALTLEEALDELRRNAGKQFDPQLAKKFIGLVEKGEVDIDAKAG